MGNEKSEKHPRAEFRPFTENAAQAFASVRSDVDLDSALVVLDTNVLRSPYRTSTSALDEIKRIYTKLRSENRLLIPGQVAREFARNRPNVVAGLYKAVRDARSLSINGRYDAPPVLHQLPAHKDAAKELEKARAAVIACRAALESLSDTIASWQRADPVLDVYGSLFDSSIIRELSLEPTAIDLIRKTRYDAKVPPGYKDRGKDDGGDGDLVIWLTILEAASAVKRDAVFVTEETKEDWFHRAETEPVFPRYELGIEFSAVTSGKAFNLLSLSKLLNALGAKEAVVQEVEMQERAPKSAWSAHVEVEGQLVDRLGAAVDENGTITNDPMSFPELTLEVADSRLGVGLVMIADRSVTAISAPAVRAARLIGKGAFSEIALVFVAQSGAQARWLEEQLAKRSSLGIGISTILVQLTGSGLVILINETSHPVLRRAFAIGVGLTPKSRS